MRGRWDTWTPQDPATLSEEKEREEEEEHKRSEQFEENNAEFCAKMIDDMKVRSEARYANSTIHYFRQWVFFLVGASAVVQQLCLQRLKILYSWFLTHTTEFALSKFAWYVTGAG